MTEGHAACSGDFRDELIAAYRFVDISNDCTANDEECRPLKSRQNPKDKERCQIWREGSSDTEAGEQRSTSY